MSLLNRFSALVLPFALLACNVTSGGGQSGGAEEGGAGGGVTETGGAGGNADCPSLSDPAVHYLSQDPAMCGLTDCGGATDCIPCDAGQEYFQNECGCGCIDAEPVCPDPSDPTVHYLETDPALCGLTDCGGATDCIPCDVGQDYFENECGCGCIDQAPEPICPDPSDPAVHYIETDPALCGMTDCGESDCIPCDAGQEYFENECGCGCIDVGV